MNEIENKVNEFQASTNAAIRSFEKENDLILFLSNSGNEINFTIGISIDHPKLQHS